MLVHRSPQPVRDPTENHAHLVYVPAPTASGLAAPERFSAIRTEANALRSNCLVADVDAPLEQQFLHVPIRKQETMVKIDRVRDD